MTQELAKLLRDSAINHPNFPFEEEGYVIFDAALELLEGSGLKTTLNPNPAFYTFLKRKDEEIERFAQFYSVTSTQGKRCFGKSRWMPTRIFRRYLNSNVRGDTLELEQALYRTMPKLESDPERIIKRANAALKLGPKVEDPMLVDVHQMPEAFKGTIYEHCVSPYFVMDTIQRIRVYTREVPRLERNKLMKTLRDLGRERKKNKGRGPYLLPLDIYATLLTCRLKDNPGARKISQEFVTNFLPDWQENPHGYRNIVNLVEQEPDPANPIKDLTRRILQVVEEKTMMVEGEPYIIPMHVVKALHAIDRGRSLRGGRNISVSGPMRHRVKDMQGFEVWQSFENAIDTLTTLAYLREDRFKKKSLLPQVIQEVLMNLNKQKRAGKTLTEALESSCAKGKDYTCYPLTELVAGLSEAGAGVFSTQEEYQKAIKSEDLLSHLNKKDREKYLFLTQAVNHEALTCFYGKNSIWLTEEALGMYCYALSQMTEKEEAIEVLDELTSYFWNHRPKTSKAPDTSLEDRETIREHELLAARALKKQEAAVPQTSTIDDLFSMFDAM